MFCLHCILQDTVRRNGILKKNARLGRLQFNGFGTGKRKCPRRTAERCSIPSRIFQSSGRAVDSARAMLQNRSIPFITDDRLKEISIGRWEGKTYDEIKQSDPDLLEAYFNTPETYMPDESESFYDFERRVSQAYQFILRRHREGNVLIVSHSVFILMLLNLIKRGRSVNYGTQAMFMTQLLRL